MDMMDDRTMLTVEGVAAGYGQVQVLHCVSLQVRRERSSP
jgi:ABC-type branched-subunit amino acid transport system ATPase component